jgi:hypothetical protein
MHPALLQHGRHSAVRVLLHGYSPHPRYVPLLLIVQVRVLDSPVRRLARELTWRSRGFRAGGEDYRITRGTKVQMGGNGSGISADVNACKAQLYASCSHGVSARAEWKELGASGAIE